MAIIGMTHRQPQFPEIGQLRKGSVKQKKVKDGKEYEIFGKDLDHFRFTSEIPEAVTAFEAAYDGQPRLVNVILPFATTDENWEAWQEEYVAGGLVHRCDGKTAVLSQRQDGTYSTDPVPCPYAADPKKRTRENPGCKPAGRLKVIVPELRRLAYVTVLTNSRHDIRHLDEQLRALEAMRQDLRGIPMQLRRSLDTISCPGPDGKRVRRQKWLLSIEAAPSWVDLQLAAQEAAAVPQLPPGSRTPRTATGPVVNGTTGEILDDDEEWDEEVFGLGEEAGPEGPQPAPSPPPVNGNRPLAPDKIRDAIRKKAGWLQGKIRAESEPITEKQVNFVVTLMTEAVKQDGMTQAMMDKARHDILQYLCGVDSTNRLSKKEASAIIDWLNADGQGINEYGQAEAKAILQAVAIEAGQLALM